MKSFPMGHLDLRHYHVRALAAFLRFLPGPLVFEPSPERQVCWPGIAAPQGGLFVVAKDVAMRLPLHVLEQAVITSKTDAIRIVLDKPDATSPFSYDLVMHNAGKAEVMKDYLLHLAPEGATTFVPPLFGDAIRLGSSGLVSTCEMPFANRVERLHGIGRANGIMAMVTWGRELREQRG